MTAFAEAFTWGDAVVFNATGLLFVVLGVFILIRMAGFPDLTVDGSFTVGAALYSVFLVAGWSTPVALSAAALGGLLAGLLTWTINSRLGVGKVVSGFLSMIILVLSSPYISGGSTKGLLNVPSFHATIDRLDSRVSRTILGDQPYQAHIVFSFIWIAFFLLAGTAVAFWLTSRRGLRLRYLGSAISPTLLPAPERGRHLLSAMMIGNGIIAVGGAVEAERRGGYTNNMGMGILLVSLAVLVLGEALVKSLRKRDFLRLNEYAVAIVIGTVLYSAGIQFLLALRIDFVDLRLLTALFLVVLLGTAGRAYSSSTKLF